MSGVASSGRLTIGGDLEENVDATELVLDEPDLQRLDAAA